MSTHSIDTIDRARYFGKTDVVRASASNEISRTDRRHGAMKYLDRATVDADFAGPLRKVPAA